MLLRHGVVIEIFARRNLKKKGRDFTKISMTMQWPRIFLCRSWASLQPAAGQLCDNQAEVLLLTSVAEGEVLFLVFCTLGSDWESGKFAYRQRRQPLAGRCIR